MSDTRVTAERGRVLAAWLPALTLLALVSFARSALVAQYGSPLPFLDSWEALFEHLLTPWAEGTLRWRALFHPHFEHTILWTKLIALTVPVIGQGAWNNLALLYVNAALYAGAVTLVAAGILPALPDSTRWVLALAFALIASVPYAWANGLWELQNCWFLLVGLTALALRGALAAPGSRASRVGYAATLGLPFTFAVGAVSVLVALAARVGSAWLTIDDRALRSRAIVPWFLGVALAVVLLVAAESAVSLATSSDSARVRAVLMALAWPSTTATPLMLVSFLPWALLGCRLVVRRERDRASWFAFAFGFWTLLTIGGLALARSEQFTRIVPPRYYELLALNIAVNIGCLLGLAARVGERNFPTRYVRYASTIIVLGIATVTAVKGFNPDYVRERAAGQAQMLANIRAYYETANPRLLDRGSIGPLPYASRERFAALLDRPGTQRLLAPAITAEP